MSTKSEPLQSAWHKYDDSKDHKPTGTREAVEWAVAEGLLELPDVDPYDVLAEQMSQALLAEMATDPQGRRYRVNHAVRITKAGVQLPSGALWDSPRMSTWKRRLLGDVSRP